MDDEVEAVAAQVVDDLRERGDWTALRDVADRRILRLTLQVIGELDLELLVRIACDAISPPNRPPVPAA